MTIFISQEIYIIPVLLYTCNEVPNCTLDASDTFIYLVMFVLRLMQTSLQTISFMYGSLRAFLSKL